MIDEFFAKMRSYCDDQSRVMMCTFRGNPDDDIPGKWRAKVLNSTNQIDDAANVYLCVSAMRRNARGEFRRRKENFAGGMLLMIDDVGDGPGAKFPLSILDPLPPTAMIETSPGNWQATYFFDRLVTDQERFDALIRAFINRQFLGEDTGQAGINRVFRPPAGVNAKPKHKRDGKIWRVRCTEWRPERVYSVDQIAEAFGLELIQKRPRTKLHHPTTAAERVRSFRDTRATLRAAGMMKQEEPDLSGWIPIHCPWTDEHTGGADNGAAIRLPAPENDYHGAFRCHHGHCEQRGWSALTEWIASEAEHILDDVNAHAPAWEDVGAGLTASSQEDQGNG